MDLDTAVDSFEEVSDRLSSLKTDLERDHEHLADRVDSLETRVRDVEDDDTAEALNRDLQRLKDRIARLEQQRGGESAEPADLDTWTPEDTRLAANAWHGEVLAARLLNSSFRQALRDRLKGVDQLVDEVAACGDTVIMAGQKLANAPRDPRNQAQQEARKAYQEAKRSWRGKCTELSNRRARLDGNEQTRLDDDAELRAKNGETIKSASRDARRLYDRVRQRLDVAITSGAALPVWFTTVLGPTPPAEDTADWVDTAIQLIVYRITYGVADPVIALGATPDAQADRIQRDTYAMLHSELSNYRN